MIESLHGSANIVLTDTRYCIRNLVYTLRQITLTTSQNTMNKTRGCISVCDCNNQTFSRQGFDSSNKQRVYRRSTTINQKIVVSDHLDCSRMTLHIGHAVKKHNGFSHDSLDFSGNSLKLKRSTIFFVE